MMTLQAYFVQILCELRKISILIQKRPFFQTFDILPQNFE